MINKSQSGPDVIGQMETMGIIPVFYHSQTKITLKVLECCYEAGLQVFEFTNRGPDALKTFRDLVHSSRQFPDLVVGAGTIFSLDTARKFAEAGAQFIVSPAMIPEISKINGEAGLPWIPGCGTVTEVYQASQLGARLVKVFPGNVLGPEFVEAIRPVLPGMKFMPTGGVMASAENLGAWFGAGVSCVGMGSQLINTRLLEQADFPKMKQQIIKTIGLMKSVRKNVSEK